MYIPGNAVEVQAATNWNLIGRGMTALPPVLPPNSTVPPLSPQSAVTPARKNPSRISKLLFQFFTFS
jgi:hypothetical protein